MADRPKHKLSALAQEGPDAPARPQRRPLVSVIIPCYNYGHFLPEAVASVLTQQDVEVEAIIVDDASKDDSAERARKLAAGDPRVRVVEHTVNTGHVVAFNDGYAEATGELIVRLDADDLLTPGSLSRAAALFERHPNVGLVYGHPRHFTDALPEPKLDLRGWTIWTGRDWIRERCRRGYNCITTPEAMVRASVMQRIGPLDTRLRYAQDMEMWLRTAAVSDVGHIDGADQALHRDHAQSMSQTDGSGHLLDLGERRTVFAVLFEGAGAELDGAEQLAQLARSTLAREAVVTAYNAYDRGRVQASQVDALVEFAAETDPGITKTPHWRALAARKRVGERMSQLNPIFVGSAVMRRARYEYLYRRWTRTGV